MEDLTIKVNGKEYDVKVEETEDNRILIHCNGDVYEIEPKSKVGIFEKLKKKQTQESA